MKLMIAITGLIVSLAWTGCTTAPKSEEAKARAVALAQRAASQTSSEDWAARAQRLLYLMEQGVPTYGNVTQ